jgi:hypothetical protein
VIAPLILIFNVITFGLFWLVYHYNSLYFKNFATDTGGLIFPRAMNQLFIALYVMEVCLVGLFFLAQDELGHLACHAQGICMIGLLIGTAVFHYFLNTAYGPFSTYLPLLRDSAHHPVASTPVMEGKVRDKPVRCTLNSCCITDGSVPAGAGEQAESALSLHEYNAFIHEALKSAQPIIWVPYDASGLSNEEIWRIRGAGIHVSNANQFLNYKNQPTYNWDPPGYCDIGPHE